MKEIFPGVKTAHSRPVNKLTILINYGTKAKAVPLIGKQLRLRITGLISFLPAVGGGGGDGRGSVQILIWLSPVSAPRTPAIANQRDAANAAPRRCQLIRRAL